MPNRIEEQMDVNEKLDEKQPSVEFEFVIRKTTDGQVQMIPVSEETKPRTMNDVRGVLGTLIRNIDAEHQAAVLHQYMMQAAASMNTQGTKRTEGGIVLPD